MTDAAPSRDSAAALPVEALITSPLGEVRVWIEPDGEGGRLRTTIRHDFADAADAGLLHDALIRVAAQLETTVRRLAPVGRPAAQASPVARWLADRTEAGPAWRTPASDLYRDFLNWCDANGVRPVNQRRFGSELSDRGYSAAGQTAAGLRYRGGLRIKAAPVAVADRAGTDRAGVAA